METMKKRPQRFYLRAARLISCTIALGLIFIAPRAPALSNPCAGTLGSFNHAVDDADFQQAQQQIDKMAGDAACSGYLVPAERRLAATRLAAVQKLMGEGHPAADYLGLLVESDRPGVLWQAAATLAEAYFGERRFAEAARGFDRAIEIVKNETLTPQAPPAADIESLLSHGAQARLLAANAPRGAQGGGFVATEVRDGRIGGIFSPRVRGVVPHAVPVPITFDYRSASLTPEGEEAAMELARAIREQQPSHVTLVGHTDERGGREYNMTLSLARAQAVAAFLKEHSLDVPVETSGVGADEPLRLSDTTGLTQDDIYALNRRVEWRRD